MENVYITPDLLKRLEQKNIQIKDTGEYKKISVMLVDMRGFSHLLLRLNASKVHKLLDLYFRMLVSVVHRYDGIVDKFIGDGMMAVWGLPIEKKMDLYNSIRAGIEIRIGMFRLIPELVSIGEVPLEIGIGIGTGNVLAGFMGPHSRREFTLVGNCINRAARLQSIAFDNRIFIDEKSGQEAKAYTYRIYLPQTKRPDIFKNEKISEVEGIYELNPDYEKLRRYPRVIVAKVGGIHKINEKHRRAALIKSIGEGGIGIEMHEKGAKSIGIGDNIIIDCRKLKIFGIDKAKGIVVRKKELTGSGIYRLKTWDIGVKFLEIPEETKNRLYKVLVGKDLVQSMISE